MTTLTKQDEARIMELARITERLLSSSASRLPGVALESRVNARKASAEAFRIATSARTALRALCESGYAPVSALVADGGAA